MLLHVPATHVDRAWKDGAYKLAESCKTSGGEITGEQLKMMLARGERILLKGENNDGWVVVAFEQLPNLRVLHIYSLYAPGHMTADYLEELKKLARDNGASEVRCCAGPAQERLYRMKHGFEAVYTTMRVPV